ncbi:MULTISPECIES: histidine kinase [unclassified Agrococcus]|uniref:ATP-binding protein n=1 Tax=unclassified Agrococcus TaxID=2615065 RepID=UPI00361292E6
MPATRRRPTKTELRNDVIVAAVLGLVSAVVGVLGALAQYLMVREDVPGWVFVLTSVAMAAPLAVRRVWPWATAIATCALYVVFGQLGIVELTVSQIIMFLAFYTVGAWDPNRRRAFWVRLVVVIGMAGWLGWAFVTVLVDEPATTAIVATMLIQTFINVAYFGGAWVFGDRAYTRALEQEELEDAHAEIVSQRDRLAEQAVTLERVRIARELHDVVAHHVSAMGIQAGAARRTLRTDADRAEHALRNVEQSARDAIAELRTMVVALRSDGDGDGPMPTLADVDGLLATAQDAGQIVDYQVVGEPMPISPMAELTLVRVLQESLTNARKHAGPTAHVDARLRYRGDVVEVEVSDDGHGAPARALGTGMGLTGMRERVAAVGGTVETGPRASGGWLVRATLPARVTAAPSDDAASATPRDPRRDAASSIAAAIAAERVETAEASAAADARTSRADAPTPQTTPTRSPE